MHLNLYVTEDEIFPTNEKCHVGLEILTVVTMKNMVFRVVTLYSAEKVQYVMSSASSGLKSHLSTCTAGFMFSLLFDSEDQGNMFLWEDCLYPDHMLL